MSGQLSRVMPFALLLAVLIAGAGLGYLWAVSAVQVDDTGPWQMHIQYQGIYAQAVADAYALDNNADTAIERLSFLCQSNGDLEAALQEAKNRYASADKVAHIDALQSLIASGQVVPNSDTGVCSSNAVSLNPLFRIVAIGLLVLIGAGIVIAGVFRMIQVNEETAIPTAGTSRPATAGGPPPPTERAKPTSPGISLPGFGKKKVDEDATMKSAAAQGAALSAAAPKTDFSAQGSEPPIIQFMTTYLHGDDLYDDSFSIETPSGEFLGETGVGISETLATTDAKNVAAFEVWLFDKNDIRTVTKVVMSDHAFNDDAIRARLAPKGEAVQAEANKRVILETASLRIQARVVDISYLSGPVPPNGVFDRITIELAAWKKDAQGGSPPMATPSRVNLPSN